MDHLRIISMVMLSLIMITSYFFRLLPNFESSLKNPMGSFERWSIQYNHVYESAEAYEYRKVIFNKNLEYI